MNIRENLPVLAISCALVAAVVACFVLLGGYGLILSGSLFAAAIAEGSPDQKEGQEDSRGRAYNPSGRKDRTGTDLRRTAGDGLILCG